MLGTTYTATDAFPGCFAPNAEITEVDFPILQRRGQRLQTEVVGMIIDECLDTYGFVETYRTNS